jgi:hypothetical protein
MAIALRSSLLNLTIEIDEGLRDLPTEANLQKAWKYGEKRLKLLCFT